MRKRLIQLAPIGLIVLALGLPVLATAETGDPAEQEARVQGFDLDEKLGDDVSLVRSGPNEGLFRVELDDGRALTTHGPDKAPQAGEHGTSMGPGDPERAPVCADDDTQQILYGYPAGAENRTATVVPEIRAAVRRMNAVLNSESVESGGPTLDYRVKCDGGGEIKVDTFVGPAGGDSFGDVASAASAAGHNDAGTKYSIFYDTNASGGYCGVASLYNDDRPGPENYNNGSATMFAVTHRGCWNGATPMHENGHNMGAVQAGAPKSTGSGGHCFQEHDVMCYSPDGGDRNQGGVSYDCTDHLHFDCEHDDYFDSSPEPGEYLASHWNLGSAANRFLESGDRGPNTAPTADFSVICPSLVCYFTDTSNDPDGWIAERAWSFGDGETSTAPNPGHVFASSGTRNVTLTVTDDRGASHAVTKAVTVTSDNQSPTARDDAVSVEKNVARDVTVLVNDSDPNGDALSIVAVADPAHGSATVNAGGRSIRYTPDGGFRGADSFVYRVSDGRGGQATATTRVTVRDTVGPVVREVTPADRSTNVSPGANVTARFSEPLTASTLSGASVRLVRRGAVSPVRATLRYNATSRVVTLDPSVSLVRGASYNATVTTAVRDAAGNRMSANRTWSFTTRW